MVFGFSCLKLAEAPLNYFMTICLLLCFFYFFHLCTKIAGKESKYNILCTQIGRVLRARGLVFKVTPAIFILDQLVQNIQKELFVEFRLNEFLNCRQNEIKENFK